MVWFGLVDMAERRLYQRVWRYGGMGVACTKGFMVLCNANIAPKTGGLAGRCLAAD